MKRVLTLSSVRIIAVALPTWIVVFVAHLSAQELRSYFPPEYAQQTASSLKLPISRVRPQDEIWLVSTHRFLHDHGSGQQADTWVLNQSGRFEAADFSELARHHNQVAERQTVIAVHGNRTEMRSAVSCYFEAYRRLWGKFPDAPPVRLVIWVWPSRGQGRLLPTTKQNYQRTCREGELLFQHLVQFDRERKLSVVGFSYGARILLSSLDCFERSENRLGPELAAASKPRQLNFVLVAAATDANWPRNNHQSIALANQVNQIVMINNSRDVVLKLFKYVTPECDQALGRVGVKNMGAVPGGSDKILQYDLGAVTGRQHGLLEYLDSSTILKIIRQHVLWKSIRLAKPVQQLSELKTAVSGQSTN